MIINDLIRLDQLENPNLVLNERKLVLNELKVRFKRVFGESMSPVFSL